MASDASVRDKNMASVSSLYPKIPAESAGAARSGPSTWTAATAEMIEGTLFLGDENGNDDISPVWSDRESYSHNGLMQHNSRTTQPNVDSMPQPVQIISFDPIPSVTPPKQQKRKAKAMKVSSEAN